MECEAARGRDEKSDRTLTHSPRAMNQCKTGTLPSPWLLEIKDAKLTGLPSGKFTLVMQKVIADFTLLVTLAVLQILYDQSQLS